MLVSDSSPLLPAKQSSSDSIPSCNVYFSTSAENCCMRHACGGGGVWWFGARQKETVRKDWKRHSHTGNDSQEMPRVTTTKTF